MLLDIIGQFWRAVAPEKRAKGQLTVDDTGRILLKLWGSIEDHNRFSYGMSLRNDGLTFYEQHTIHGISDEQFIKISQCQRLYAPRAGTEDYEALSVLIGPDIPEDHQFNVALFRFENLEHWTSDLPTNDKKAEIEFRKMKADMSIVGDSSSTMIELDFPDRCHVATITELFSHIQMLGKIGLGEDVPLVRMSVARDDSKQTITLFTGNVRLDNSVGSEEFWQLHWGNVWFRMRDIDGIAGVKQWIELYDKFRPVLDLIKDARKKPLEQVESNFIRLVIAVEAFARIKKGKQSINFKKELRDMITKEARENAKDLSAKIVKFRNNLVFHRGLRGDFSIHELYRLSESMYCLLILCLLRECGLREEILTRVRSHQYVMWALGESINDVD